MHAANHEGANQTQGTDSQGRRGGRRKREEYVNKRGASRRWRSRIRHALFNAAKEPPVRKMAEHGEREYELAPTN